MIFEILINTFLFLFNGILYLIPSLPPMPEIAIEITNYIFDTISDVIGVIKWVYGYQVFLLIFTIYIALFNFKPIYMTWLWVATKIPFFKVNR